MAATEEQVKDIVHETPARSAWRTERERLETFLSRRVRSTPQGLRKTSPLELFDPLMGMAFRLSGLAGAGRRNACLPTVSRVAFRFAHLPAAFHGYRILLVTDPHSASLPEAIHYAARLADGLHPDLVLLGGDYQCRGKPAATESVRCLAPLLGALTPPDGMLAVLGNHDRLDMVEALGAHGVAVLANESATIRRGDEHITVVGLDDVHCFYTEAAPAALKRCAEGFRIALVHTPEAADLAAASGYALYLAGHTHGGQVCLPGGRHIFTALDSHHHLASGAWTHRGMHGYTSRGLGVGGVPVRFHCPPELVLITLERA
jgi:hypothetical protein